MDSKVFAILISNNLMVHIVIYHASRPPHLDFKATSIGRSRWRENNLNRVFKRILECTSGKLVTDVPGHKQTKSPLNDVTSNGLSWLVDSKIHDYSDMQTKISDSNGKLMVFWRRNVTELEQMLTVWLLEGLVHKQPFQNLARRAWPCPTRRSGWCGPKYLDGVLGGGMRMYGDPDKIQEYRNPTGWTCFRWAG